MKVERVEYVKPIMFSGGVGSIDDEMTKKIKCKPGQIVAKIGGPVYRIGVGGGAASSLLVQGFLIILNTLLMILLTTVLRNFIFCKKRSKLTELH